MRTQIRIIVDFLFKITQPRRKWNGIIKVFKKKKKSSINTTVNPEL